MKTLLIAFFVLTIMLGGVSMQTAFAADCGKDNALDQAGDWFATLGKQGMEKDQIIVKRKADRLAACAKKQAEEAGKAADKAGKDLKKKMGF